MGDFRPHVFEEWTKGGSAPVFLRNADLYCFPGIRIGDPHLVGGLSMGFSLEGVVLRRLRSSKCLNHCETLERSYEMGRWHGYAVVPTFLLVSLKLRPQFGFGSGSF